VRTKTETGEMIQPHKPNPTSNVLRYTRKATEGRGRIRFAIAQMAIKGPDEGTKRKTLKGDRNTEDGREGKVRPPSGEKKS